MTKILLNTASTVLTRLWKLSLLGLVFAVAAATLVSSRIPTTLEEVKSSGKLIVISRNGPTTYYEGPAGHTGFEYVMAKAFAKHLGVDLEVREIEDLGEMLDKVGTKAGHLAASGLTVTEKRARKVLFAEPYLQVTQQLIYRSGENKPETIEDLYGKRVMVISNSSHSERLKELQREYRDLAWEEQHDVDMLDLLEMVHNGKIDYTIVDSNAYQINRPVYPKATVAFDISEPQDLAWAFPQQKDASLYNEAQKFFKDIKQTGAIDDAMETFYGHLGEIDYSGAILFAHRLQSRLPKWETHLKAAAEKNDLDWQLLAALSYQESHWNPKAKSPTGVRGFMMLTLNTAKEVGVKNRLNAEQSIYGGARYFKSLHGRLPERIKEPDRTWLALAAYNIGLGHLEDARILTEHFGGNPDKWADVKQQLPLLAKRKYYKFTKHGYARGWEAVDYVQNIRNFHTIIAWNEIENQRLQQLAQNENHVSDYAQFSPTVTEAVKSISGTSSL